MELKTSVIGINDELKSIADEFIPVFNDEWLIDNQIFILI
jgi:hypothetical protein